MDGTWKEWTDAGLLFEEDHYVQGVSDGYQIHYSFGNGAIVQVERHVNGKREGRMRAWNDDGTLKAEWCYRQGELQSYQPVLTRQPKPTRPPRPSDIDAPCP